MKHLVENCEALTKQIIQLAPGNNAVDLSSIQPVSVTSNKQANKRMWTIVILLYRYTIVNSGIKF